MCLYVSVCALCGGQRTTWETSVLSFYHVEPRHGTQVVGLSAECLYLSSHLTTFVHYVFKTKYKLSCIHF